MFVPDLPGFGRSDKPRHAFSIDELADNLADWMATVGLPRANFLGNSMGCQVIVELAVQRPDLIQRAVLVGPTVDTQGRSMIVQLARGAADLWHEPWSLFPILAHDYWLTGTRRMVQTLHMALADPVEKKFPRVNVPILVVRGAYDTIAPQRWVEQIARTLPDGTLVIVPRATHAAHYAAAEAVARIANDFFAP